MYDEGVVKTFLEGQLKLYPENVAETYDEALEYLEDAMAVVADSEREVFKYLEDAGVDTEGLTHEEILNMPEIFETDDGRFLILEI